MTDFNVLDLTDGRAVDLDTHLAGAWGTAQFLELAAGSSHPFGDDTTETCLFVIDGTAEMALDGGTREVAAGTGVTLVRGTRVVLSAQDPVRAFVATVNT